MNETSAKWRINQAVTYAGDNRTAELEGKVGTIKQFRYGRTGAIDSIGVDFPSEDLLVWAAPWSWNIVHTDTDFDVERIFTEAAGGPLAVAKAEIERLETRLAELKAAVKVIESI